MIMRIERSRGRQRKRWMDNVRENLEERGIQLSTAYGKNKNREVWRNIIRASSLASWWKFGHQHVADGIVDTNM